MQHITVPKLEDEKLKSSKFNKVLWYIMQGAEGKKVAPNQKPTDEKGWYYTQAFVKQASVGDLQQHIGQEDPYSLH